MLPALLTCRSTAYLNSSKVALFGRGRVALAAGLIWFLLGCLVGRASTPHSAYINHTLLFLIRARE